MKLSHKAILLNTFILPGVGHFVLKRPILGSIYAMISLACMLFIFYKVIQLSQAIVENLGESLARDEASSLIGVLADSSSSIGLQSMGTAFIIYLVLWLISILDAYRISNFGH